MLSTLAHSKVCNVSMRLHTYVPPLMPPYALCTIPYVISTSMLAAPHVYIAISVPISSLSLLGSHCPGHVSGRTLILAKGSAQHALPSCQNSIIVGAAHTRGMIMGALDGRLICGSGRILPLSPILTCNGNALAS